MAEQVLTQSYEYAHLSVMTTNVNELVLKLNNLAAEGWELVSSHSADKTLGFNSVTAMLRRAIIPLDHPTDPSEGWKKDPCGRYDWRHWNGRAWTFDVGWDKDRGSGRTFRDPPTQLAPTAGLVQ